MTNKPLFYDLLDQYGSTLAGFARCALVATDPSSGAAERSDALVAMGHIARYRELDVSVDQTGLPFFMQAIKYDARNVRACREILSLYKEPPDGHTNEVLAAGCLAVLDAASETMHELDRYYLAEVMRSIECRKEQQTPSYRASVFELDDLRRHPEYCRMQHELAPGS